MPLIASELEMSKSLVRQYLEIIVDLAEIKKEEKRIFKEIARRKNVVVIYHYLISSHRQSIQT